MMKNILLLFTLVLTTSIATAQTTDPYIETAGQTTYQREVKHYEATIKISSAHTYGKETQLTLEERKALFFEKAEELGLNENQFRMANIDENASPKSAKNEINFIVQTSREDEIQKILSLGKLDSWSYKIRENVVYKPVANKSKIIKEALKDAKNKAELIANVIGKKIGETLVISDYNYEDKPDLAYYSKEKRYYRIVVRFAIK